MKQYVLYHLNINSLNEDDAIAINKAVPQMHGMDQLTLVAVTYITNSHNIPCALNTSN